MNFLGRKIVLAVLALGATAALAVATAGVATAATARNGVCEVGEFCLFYLTDLQGSVSDFGGSIPDYGATQPGCYEFKGAGPGQGYCVKNEARSAWNRRPFAGHVFYNSNYGGAYDTIGGHSSANLTVTFDNNASHSVA